MTYTKYYNVFTIINILLSSTVSFLVIINNVNDTEF